jgi:hypothetical protein
VTLPIVFNTVPRPTWILQGQLLKNGPFLHVKLHCTIIHLLPTPQKKEATSLTWPWQNIAGSYQFKQANGFCWFSLSYILLKRSNVLTDLHQCYVIEGLRRGAVAVAQSVKWQHMDGAHSGYASLFVKTEEAWTWLFAFTKRRKE